MSEEIKTYIGDKEVKMTINQDDGSIKIVFSDDSEVLMKNELYSIMKSDQIGKGGITDNINHYFAKKVIAEMALFDLNYSFVEGVAIGIVNLANNLREDAIGRKFNCSGTHMIKLGDLLL